MINDFKLEKLSFLNSLFPDEVFGKELSKDLKNTKVSIRDGEVYVSEEVYEQTSFILKEKGYSITTLLSFEDVIEKSLKEGYITDSYLLELLQKEGLLKRYLIRVPFSKRLNYSLDLLTDIHKSVNSGGVITLAKKGSKTVKTVTEETGIPFKRVLYLIKVLELNIHSFNNILLFSEADITTLVNNKDIKLSDTKYLSSITIKSKAYIPNTYYKDYLTEKGVTLKSMQYLFNIGVLDYVLKSYNNDIVRVTPKDELDLFIEFCKTQKRKLNLEEASYLRYSFLKTNSIKESIELLNSCVNLKQLSNIIKLNYKSFGKASQTVKETQILAFLNNVDYVIASYTDNKCITRQVFNLLHMKSILGTLKIKEDGYVSSLLLATILGSKSKYLVNRERTKGNSVLDFDFTTDKYLFIETLPKEEQDALIEYTERKIKEQS